jgi:hypothetical protein
MMSEWMKVMLEEIARKREDAEQAKIEQRRRREEEAAALPQESDRIPKRR